MDSNILELAKSWISNPAIASNDKSEIEKLLQEKNQTELTDRFYRDLEFGTGGLRAVLGMGLNRINRYSVRRATQAMANTLKKKFPQQKTSIVVSYDSRHFSLEFAKEVCGVFAANQITASIFSELTPVSLLSWAIRELKAHAGVMITASHNPPVYNGYKAYWQGGAQVTPPIDEEIISEYNRLTDLSQIPVLAFEEGLKQKSIQWVSQNIENAYYEMLKSYSYNPELCLQKGENLKIVFTPLHGTGKKPCLRILKEMGFKNVAIVPEQAEPNGHFPTVKSPNPENPEAMDLAVKLMLKNKADLAFGTDPDADRLGVVLNLETGPYYLNGNQIGTLMLHYILTQKKAKNLLPKKSLFIKTIVTSKLQDTIAKRFDVKVENTLTGFKWMAKKLKEYEDAKSDYQFIFATEESFGYLPQDRVRDKDGVHSVALCAEIALFYKLKGKNLYQALDDIYSEFGFSSEELLCLDYFGIEGAEKIKRIMTSFRNFKENTFAGEEIELVEDFLTGQTTYKKSSLTEKILVTPSDVLGFGLKGGHFVYLRPSGTEPKIKFYIMVQVTDGELQDKKQQAKLLTAKILTFIQNYCRDI